MTTLRLFLDGAVLQYRALFGWISPTGYATTKIALPLFQLIFFVQLGIFATGRANALYFVIGNALQITAVNGVHGVMQTVGFDREFGALPYVLGSPANRLTSYVGRAFVHIFDGMSTVVIGFILAAIVYGLDLHNANLPLFALCIVLVSATTCGLGLMMGSLSLIARDVMAISNSVYFVLLVMCGVNFPVSSLPVWLQPVSWILPMTRGVQAAREAVAGASFMDVIPLLAGELLVGIAYVVAGYFIFRFLEFQARRGGLQEAV